MGALTSLLPTSRLSLRRWRELCLEGSRSGSSLVPTRSGVVECALAGTGSPVVVLHGLGGGHDHGLWIARRLRLHRHRVVAVSRPGYLRTAVALGPDPWLFADCLRDLLDALGLEQAAILGSSAGGMSALAFALRHPERCAGLVMLAAVSRRIRAASLMASLPLSALADLANWAFECRPRIRALLGPYYRWPLTSNPRRRSRLLRSPAFWQAYAEMLRTNSPAAPRATGRALDLRNLARFPAAPRATLPLPALVVHGRTDPAVPFSHALNSLGWLPRAELVAVPDGGHLLPLTHPHLGRLISRFLERCLPQSTP